MEMMMMLTVKEFETLRKMMLNSSKYFLKSDVDAEEVVGNVIEKMAFGKFNVSTKEGLEKVLKKAIRNACIDLTRSRNYKMRNSGRLTSIEATGMQLNNFEDSSDSEKRELMLLKLDSELENLNEKEQTLIRLKYLEGYTYEEIVPILGGNSRSLCVMAGRIIRKLEIKICA